MEKLVLTAVFFELLTYFLSILAHMTIESLNSDSVSPDDMKTLKILRATFILAVKTSTTKPARVRLVNYLQAHAGPHDGRKHGRAETMHDVRGQPAACVAVR
jgi:hypothetical protein